MAGAEQREGERSRNPGGGIAAAQPEPGRCLGRGEAGRGEQREAHRCDRSDQDRPQPRLRFRRAFAGAGADLQHLGGGDALRIGQVGSGDERAPQRNRQHDAHHPARRAEQEALPEGEALPPSDHDQRRQHEDDRGDAPGRRRHRLDDIVFVNRGAAHESQHRHRDHRRRNRGGKGQPHPQAEIDIGRCEDERDQRAEDQSPDGQFAADACRRDTAVDRFVLHRRPLFQQCRTWPRARQVAIRPKLLASASRNRETHPRLTAMKVKYTTLSISCKKMVRRANFSLAIYRSQLHKERAFQASSPKTFRADPSGERPFFYPRASALEHARKPACGSCFSRMKGSAFTPLRE